MLDQSPTFGDPRLPLRFWRKVHVGSVPTHRPDLGTCWLWTAYCDRQGYGRFKRGSERDDSARMGLAHRLCYETLVGPMPDGLESDHLCRNRPCVNPDHIEAVTHSTNMKRSPLAGLNGEGKGRDGEAHGMARLTEGQVREIRHLRGIVPGRQLAARYGVHPVTICEIQLYRRWRHAP